MGKRLRIDEGGLPASAALSPESHGDPAGHALPKCTRRTIWVAGGRKRSSEDAADYRSSFVARRSGYSVLAADDYARTKGHDTRERMVERDSSTRYVSEHIAWSVVGRSLPQIICCQLLRRHEVPNMTQTDKSRRIVEESQGETLGRRILVENPETLLRSAGRPFPSRVPPRARCRTDAEFAGHQKPSKGEPAM